MKSQLPVIANGFYIASVVLGLPSLAGTLFFGIATLRLWMMKLPADQGPSQSGDNMLRLMENTIRVFDVAGRFMSGLAQGVIAALAIASVCALLFAAALFFTGRGLHAGVLWSRVAAGVFVFALLGISTIAFLSMRGSAFSAAPGLFSLASGYALWALWHG